MNVKGPTFFIINFFFLSIQAEKKPLYVGVLMEQSKNWYTSYTSCFPDMFEYVFEQILNTTDVLSDYEIKQVVRDTQGKPGLAARNLIEMIQEDPPKVAIIGPTLSDSLTVTGQIVPFYNLIELSYIASTATTSYRDLFSTLFRVNQGTDALNSLRIEMMKYFGWTRVGTIAYQDEFSVSQIDDFHGLLRDYNMTLVTSAVISETSNVKDILKNFKQFGVRIIMGALRGAVAPEIFCKTKRYVVALNSNFNQQPGNTYFLTEMITRIHSKHLIQAYHLDMFGDSHVWILSGPAMFDGWIDEAFTDNIGCTKEQLIESTQGHFTLDNSREAPPNDQIVSGQTTEQAMEELKAIVSRSGCDFSSFAGWIYDTPWALALGLNNSIKHLEGAGLKLHEYNYSSVYLQEILRGMREVHFKGLSGPVAFDDIGGRIGINFIQQNFYGVKNNVASFDEIKGRLTWLVDSSSLWSGKEVPQDRFIYQDVLVAPSSMAFGLIVSLDSGGCFLSFTFLFFNIYYRKNKSIKMSSPMVNNVIIAGCLLMYIEIFVNSFDYFRNLEDETGNNLCMVRVWLLSVGFTSLFGALFSKTYRVYVVFRDHKLKTKAIKDYHLFGMIGIMLVIDIVLLVIWTAIYPLEKTKVSRRNMDVLHNNMIFSESFLHCQNNYSAYWIAAMYVYKGLLLAFGTFLAWETRHVTVPVLNDSKYIGACIYNVVTICIFGVPMAHVLPIDQMTLTFVLESCLLFFCTTICQCIIFIPKIKMRNQVHGKFLTSSLPNETNSSMIKPSGVTTEFSRNESKTYEDLKEENVKLRMDIANEAIAIAKLRNTLMKMTGNIHFTKSGTEYVVFKSSGLSSSSTAFSDEEKKDKADKF